MWRTDLIYTGKNYSNQYTVLYWTSVLYCTVLYCTALYQTELHCILPAIVECQLNLPLFFLSHCKNNVLLLILLCQCQCLNFWQYILFESTPILTYLVISESLILLFNIVIWKIKIQKQCNEYSKCRQMEAFHTLNDPINLAIFLFSLHLFVLDHHLIQNLFPPLHLPEDVKNFSWYKILGKNIGTITFLGYGGGSEGLILFGPFMGAVKPLLKKLA